MAIEITRVIIYPKHSTRHNQVLVREHWLSAYVRGVHSRLFKLDICRVAVGITSVFCSRDQLLPLERVRSLGFCRQSPQALWSPRSLTSAHLKRPRLSSFVQRTMSVPRYLIKQISCSWYSYYAIDAAATPGVLRSLQYLALDRDPCTLCLPSDSVRRFRCWHSSQQTPVSTALFILLTLFYPWCTHYVEKRGKDA